MNSVTRAEARVSPYSVSMSPAPGNLVLVRHGQTEWAVAGKHTGLTDLPLLPAGEQGARNAGRALAHRSFVRVLSSPLQRARRTADLAGLTAPGGVEIENRLLEWDYGGYEGMTTAEIREVAGSHWTVFSEGIIPGATPGETIEHVADRVGEVLRELRADQKLGDVAIVGHGHCLRILTAVYLRQNPRLAESLYLDAGAVSILGARHGHPVVQRWNCVPGVEDL